MGFSKGDKVALISDNIPEILFMVMGTQSVGGMGAGIYQTSLPDEIADILNYLEVKYRLL